MMMSSLRVTGLAALLLAGAPALAQQPEQDADTVRITATPPPGRTTLMSHFAQNPLPTSVAELVTRLNAPGVCGKDDRPTPDPKQACAIIVYYLVDREEAASTPLLVFRAIQYATHPDNPEDTALRMIDIDGRVQQYSQSRLDEPLRPMRVENSCKRLWTINKDLGKVKKCRKVNARYIPIGILGYGENESHMILTGKSKDALFSISIDIGENVREGLR